LSNFFKKLHQNGCPVLLSNSDPKNNNINDNFFDDLYDGFVIKRVQAMRIINSNINKRGQISELLIKNY
jgi:DNA adenine methylase